MTLHIAMQPLPDLAPGVVAAVGYAAGPRSPKLQSAAARRVLAWLLRDGYGIEELPPIAKDERGKPWMPEHPEIHFNLSHCGAAVLAVVGRAAVGCDIERVVDEVEDELAAVSLGAEERRELELAADPLETFTRIWTCKEAIAKRGGEMPDDVRLWPSADPHVTTRRTGRHIISIAW